MDNLKKYEKYIIDILQEYKQYSSSNKKIEMQTLIDKENHHYQLSSVGWDKDYRIHGCLLHLDIKNNKIWIQHDGTEEGVANLLVEKGVSKKKIILAFHAPHKRPYTEFAVG